MDYEPHKITFIKNYMDYRMWSALLRTLLKLGNSLEPYPISVRQMNENGNYTYIFKQLRHEDEDW